MAVINTNPTDVKRTTRKHWNKFYIQFDNLGEMNQFLKKTQWLGMVAHAYNASYVGDTNRRHPQLTQDEKIQHPMWKIISKQNRLEVWLRWLSTLTSNPSITKTPTKQTNHNYLSVQTTLTGPHDFIGKVKILFKKSTLILHNFIEKNRRWGYTSQHILWS